MGKNRSKKRRLDQQQQTQASPSSIAASLAAKKPSWIPNHSQPTALDDEQSSGISASDLTTTIATLQKISSREGPPLENIASKEFKELRRALHPFQEAWRERFDPIDYPARVTHLLEVHQWSAALFALDGCAYYYSDKIKRGTIQRWVRFCDDCQNSGVKLRLISAILKTTNNSGQHCDSKPSFNKHDPRRAMLLEASSSAKVEITKRSTWEVPQCEQSAQIPDSEWTLPQDIHVVHHVAKDERKPPNRYDLNIFSTKHLLLSKNYNTQHVAKHVVESIPGAFLLSRVLQPHECQRLIQTAESMGFTPDHPVQSDVPTGIDTCEWLAVQQSQIIYERVRQLLPQEIDSEAVSGINARWRLFRYGLDSVYRPHIDGSWPASKLSEDGRRYISDDSQRSRLTFLIYLNAGFSGGGTTFYLPSPEGGLEAVSVTPHAGNVLVFPQGNTASLVHEGSKVLGGRCKYVIRTDVLFQLSANRTQVK